MASRARLSKQSGRADGIDVLASKTGSIKQSGGANSPDALASRACLSKQSGRADGVDVLLVGFMSKQSGRADSLDVIVRVGGACLELLDHNPLS